LRGGALRYENQQQTAKKKTPRHHAWGWGRNGTQALTWGLACETKTELTFGQMGLCIG